MQSRTALAGTALLAALLVIASPRLSLSPGPMTRGHGEIANNCLACHAPLRGLPPVRCIGCHPLDSIGISPPPERSAGADSVLAGMHRSFSRTDCLECHTDHAGPDSATRSFSHEALSPELGRQCTTCHDGNRPADELHRQAGSACGDCHTTRAWKPATFDHQKTIKGTACSACHGQRRPADELHRQVGDDCGACHTTRAWKPATFEHDRYFVLDRDHQASCRTCHTEAGTYKTYTCYGCHEHTQSGMTAKHQEEGIIDFRDCVRCHRSADEHEGGREGGRENHEGGREHEHSD
jgi:cytochrome c7-like protein